MKDTKTDLDQIIDDVGLSLAELAKRSGISARQIWTLRRHPTRARSTTVNALAKALGVSTARVRRAIGRM